MSYFVAFRAFQLACVFAASCGHVALGSTSKACVPGAVGVIAGRHVYFVGGRVASASHWDEGLVAA